MWEGAISICSFVVFSFVTLAHSQVLIAHRGVCSVVDSERSSRRRSTLGGYGSLVETAKRTEMRRQRLKSRAALNPRTRSMSDRSSFLPSPTWLSRSPNDSRKNHLEVQVGSSEFLLFHTDTNERKKERPATIHPKIKRERETRTDRKEIYKELYIGEVSMNE